MEQSGGFDETAVVNRARGGDFHAFAELVKRHEASIFRLARHFTRNQADAEDLLHGTFLDACADLDRLRDASRFRPWLIQLAVRRARNSQGLAWTDEPSGTEAETTAWGAPPGPVRPSDGNRETLDRALEGLRPVLRVIFVLRDMEGLRTADIADVLDVREPVVRRLLMLARMQLREWLFPPFEMNSAVAAPAA